MTIIELSESKSPELYSLIKEVKPRAKEQKVLQLVGALALVKDIGMRGLRALLNKSNEYWYRLVKDLKEVSQATQQRRPSILHSIEESLQRFEKVKMINYRNE